MTKRGLTYWKARQIDLREILKTIERSSYYGEIQQAYLYAVRKVIECERELKITVSP